MGRLSGDQDKFFYDFDLNEHVPRDHLLRRIAAVLDLDWLRDELKPYYSHTGRPSIDPELMIRMLLVGYCFGIRSERRLCEEVHLNLAYRWFCRLGLEDRVPDHSTFSLNRHGRFRESGLLRSVFEDVVRRCVSAGLVGGEGFATDASVIEAEACRYRGAENVGEIDWSSLKASRAVREYLSALEAVDTPGKPPKRIALADPCSTWTAKASKRFQFGYGLNYLIDNDNAVILDVEATPTKHDDEVRATRTMIDRVERSLHLRPKRLAGDTAYGTARMLSWLMARGIEPHIPVWDKSRRTDNTFSREDFAYDPERDVYTCPGGKTLRSTGGVHADNTLRYLARTGDCRSCSLKERCCPKTTFRKIPRDVHEDARDHARSLVGTEAYERSRHERKKVEMLFAHLKRHMRFERLRLRGFSGATDEFLLAATAQNLKRLAKLTWKPPPPAPNAA